MPQAAGVIMADKEATYIKAAIAVTVLVIVWLILKSRSKQTVVVGGESMSPFAAPYFYTNPGIPDNPGLLNGGPTFLAANTINVRTGVISGLSNQYMPMFGLVGMTAVSG